MTRLRQVLGADLRGDPLPPNALAWIEARAKSLQEASEDLDRRMREDRSRKS
jgi:hypothetical protein